MSDWRRHCSLPVNVHPTHTTLSDSNDNDEGVEGTGVTWSSRTDGQDSGKKTESERQDQARVAQKGLSADEDNEDEGIDGTGISWNNRE